MKTDQDLERLALEFFDEFYYVFSSLATTRGIHRYDYKLSSLGRQDLMNWSHFLSQTKKELSDIKRKKNIERTVDFQVLDSFVSEEIAQSSEGFPLIKNNPVFLFASLFKAFTNVGFGSYNSIGVRSRAFSLRMKDLGNFVNAFEENVSKIAPLEREVLVSETVRLSEFIEAFAGYLINKSDVEKKDEVREGKDASLIALRTLREYLAGLPQTGDFSLSKSVSLHSLEDVSKKDLKSQLSESLSYIRESLVRKAREINIVESVVSTLSRNLTSSTQITETEVQQVIKLIREKCAGKFPEFKIEIDFKKIPKDLEDKASFLMSPLVKRVVSSGEFDTKATASVVLRAVDNINFLALELVERYYPGAALMSVVRSKQRLPGKYFFNKTIEAGWRIYARREVVEDIKFKLGREFELTALYVEYMTTLKALIENEILFGRFNNGVKEALVDRNDLIVDKNAFLAELVLEEGESLMALHGLYNIIELRRQHGSKMKLADFHYKLALNSSLPVRFIRQAL